MNNLIQISGIKAIVLRELLVFSREKERIISSIISPLLFLFVIGKSLNQNANIGGYSYQQFIFPGIIGMDILFTSIRYGLYIIWDKKMDFLKEVLISPISRTSLFLGKALGGVIGAMLEMLIILVIGNFFVLKISILQMILTMIACGFVSFMVVTIGLAIGGGMKTMEGFGLVVSFVSWPMFFFSNAMFEISKSNTTVWALSVINPFTYCVDIIRKILLNYAQFPVSRSIIIILIWNIILSYITIKIFNRIDTQK
ncbi:MAG: ABC transporter permease [Elusimicrobia bacterium]|nr:ABC transporter permease [Elusimicrobiota bacterium]